MWIAKTTREKEKCGMSSRSISNIRSGFGRILSKLRFPSVSSDSKTKPESASTTMSPSTPTILNWPKPSELLHHEVETLHGIQTGKIVILSDIKIFVAHTMKRIEILSTLVEQYGDKWVGNSIELMMKFTPDMINDQPVLPPPDDPQPVTG